MFSKLCRKNQNEKGFMIRKIRRGHSGEYETSILCHENGIVHEF